MKGRASTKFFLLSIFLINNMRDNSLNLINRFISGK